MSSFRRGPNVSQYIADLNSVSPRDSSPPDNFINDDLDLFTTTDFIDFDMGENLSNLPMNSNSIPVNPAAQHALGFDQTSSGQDWSDFNFPTDFSSFTPILDTSPNFSQLPQQPQTLTQSSISPTTKTGEKRKLPTSSDIEPETPSDVLGGKHEETARVAAEEDKRRRNTAASARFRIKKKQREADLEKRAKEMTEKAAMLETKVQQLEMENKWLKSLITEKEGKGEVLAAGMDAFEAETEQGEERTDGVGTKRQKVDA